MQTRRICLILSVYIYMLLSVCLAVVYCGPNIHMYVPYAEDDRKQPTCRNCLKQMQSKAGVEITMLIRDVCECVSVGLLMNSFVDESGFVL